MSDANNLVEFAKQIYLRKLDQYGGTKQPEWLFEQAIEEAQQFDAMCKERFADARNAKPVATKKTTA